MDATSIDLTQSEISHITIDNDQIIVHFDPAILIKTLTGSEERTKWHQQGKLVFGQAQVTSEIPIPSQKVKCTGGDVGENIYTYRDMIPIPLKSHGRAHCSLKLQDINQPFEVMAESVEIQMSDRPHYIEHIRQ